MKKINRLLAFLLAFTVVITTFSSDLTAAHVYATEEEAVIDSENEIKTVEKEEIEVPVVTEASTEESTEEAATAADTEEDAEEEEENDDEATKADGEEVVDPEAAVEEEVGETVKEEEEEEEEEVLSLSAEEEDILITLSYKKGVLPEDAKLIVNKVSASVEEDIKELLDEETGDNVNVEETISFDINIYSESEGDPDNNYYVQPDGDVEVTFESVDAAEAEDTSLSVYHVTDDIENAALVSDVLSGDETDITIKTDHFSIYAVTVSSNSGVRSGYGSFNISLVDENRNAIPGREEIKVSVSGDDTSLEQIRRRVTAPDGYAFLGFSFKYDDKYYEITKIAVETSVINKYPYLHYKDKNGKTGRIKASDVKNSIYAVFKKNDRTKTTSHHIDLGFEKEDFDNYEKHATVSVKIGIEPDFHEMKVEESVKKDFYEGQDYYEFRYSRDRAFEVDEKITFKVELTGNPNPYTMVCDPTKDTKNIDALYRCIDAHWATQAEFGFDYVSNFTQDFLNNATVYYHSNFGSDPEKIVDTVNVPWTAHSETETTTTYTYKTTYPTDKDAKPYATFKGWGMKNEQGEVVEIEGSTITVSKTNPTDLYAIWEDEKQVNLVFLDWDEKTILDSKKIYASYEYSTDDYEGETPTREGYEFKEWSDPVTDNEGNVKYIATYDPIQYTIKFHKNAPANEKVTGTMGDMTLKYDESKNLTKNSYECDSYEFKGWATSRGSKVVAYTDKQNVSNLTKEINGVVNLYAVWDKITSQTVHFYLLTDSKGIPGDSSGQPKGDYYPISDSEYYSWEGTATPLKFVANKDGNGNVYDRSDDRNSNRVNKEIISRPKDLIEEYLHKIYSSSINEEDITWYVYKKQSDGYHIDGYPTGSVTYVANYTDSGLEDKVDQKIRLNKDSKTYDVRSFESAFGTSREGYTFLGWSTTPAGEVVYPANSHEKIALKEHLTLYAQWAKNVEYSVHYIIQGEDGSFFHMNEDGTSEANYYKKVDYTLQLKANETANVSVVNSAKFSQDNDLQYETNVTKTETKFSNKFMKDGVRYTVAEGNYRQNWNGLVRPNGEKINLLVYFSRDDINLDIIVTSKNQSWAYDGNTHNYNAENVAFTYDNKGNQNLVVTGITLSGNVKNVTDTVDYNNKFTEIFVKDKSTEATYKYLVNEDGTVVTTNGKATKITAIFGKLSITPRTVTLTSSTISKEFDGKALTADNSKQTDAKTITASVTVDSGDKHEGFVAGEGIDSDKIVFKGSRTRDGGEGLKENVFDDNDKDDTKFTALNSNTKPENYIITKEYGDIIVTKRSPENKYVIYVKLSADGEGAQVTRQYTGVEQAANLNVAVYAEKTILEKAAEAGEKILTTLINAGVLIVNAEEGSETPLGDEWTKLDAVPDTIDGMNVVIDNLYITGGKGTDCDYYAVFLNKKNMTVKTTIDGEEYDLADQVKIEVVDNVRTVTQGDESALREAIETTSQPEDSVEIGGLTITPAVILFTADDKYKPYGASDPKFTATISGLVGKDIPNKDAIAAFFEEYYIFDREKGEAAGGKYAISVTLPESNVRPQIEPKNLRLDGVQLEERVQPVIFSTDEVMRSVFMNYTPDFAKGVLTIGTTGGGDDDDDDDTPDTPTTVDTPVSAAPAAAVLGAVRGPVAGDAPAVLGARRAGTSDTSILGSVITIIVAAAIAFSMVFIKRKKKEEK